MSALKLVVKKMFAVNNLETDDLMPEYTYGLVYLLLYLVNILVLGIHLQKKIMSCKILKLFCLII